MVVIPVHKCMDYLHHLGLEMFIISEMRPLVLIPFHTCRVFKPGPVLFTFILKQPDTLLRKDYGNSILTF